MDSSPIGIFDSGAGGLTVLSACRKLLPREDFICLSDAKFLPYGNKPAGYIVHRAFACADRLAGFGCKAVVVACNTATNAAICLLRETFSLPFIGVEPAIKPACADGGLREIVLLCTQATAEAEKFRLLYNNCGAKTAVAPQRNLAQLIENHLNALHKIRPAVDRMLTPFAGADAVVLGCTHYVFITDMIRDFYASRGRAVKVFDGNRGVAKRLKSLLAQGNLLSEQKCAGSVKTLFN